VDINLTVPRIERRGGEFLMRRISAVAIFPCEGARDPDSERALAAVFDKGGRERVRRLYRAGELSEERCRLKVPARR
jgi:protein-L-isoaspartate(D-aspartate) O-methyltransferase